jgi:PII-like signaling protein
MRGFQLEFFTQQDLFHDGKPLSEWLLDTARSHGIRGATTFVGVAGFGQDRRFQAAHMFDLVDHPVQVVMVVNEDEYQRLFALLLKEKLNLFFVKLPVEFGKVGE